MKKNVRPIHPRLNINMAECLGKALGLSSKALPSIRFEVSGMIREVRQVDGDSPERDLLFQVSSRLIKRSALKAA